MSSTLTHAEAPVLRFLGVLQQLPHEGLVVSELGLHAHAFPPTCTAPENKQKQKRREKKEKKIATTFQQLGANHWSGKQVICRRPVSARSRCETDCQRCFTLEASGG